MNETIIDSLEPLNPRYSPTKLPERSTESNHIQSNLLSSDGASPNLYLVGPPGSGKTTTIRNIISTVSSIKTCYVPCTRFDTQYKVLKRITKTVTGQPANDGLHTSDLQRTIDQRTSEQEIAIVLDDVDFLLLNDGEDLLYFLSRLDHSHNVQLILISSVGRPLADLVDGRTTSSLQARTLSFDSYSPDQAASILTERASDAFYPRSLHRSALQYIVSSTQNISYGLSWLRHAAQTTDSTITEDVVSRVASQSRSQYVDDLLNQFTDHHKHVYQAIRTCCDPGQSLSSGTVYEQYEQHCRSRGIETLTNRTISDYLKHLECLRLISAEYHYGGKHGKSRDIELRPL